MIWICFGMCGIGWICCGVTKILWWEASCQDGCFDWKEWTKEILKGPF